jgi:hypothetical protein
MPAAGNRAAESAPWLTVARASAAPLGLVQPARLGGTSWQRAAVEQRETATQSDMPAAGNRAAGMAQPRLSVGQPSAAPLGLIQPARLGSGAWLRTTDEQRESTAPSYPPNAGDRPTASAPWLSAGRPSAAPLIQPARLIGDVGRRATAGPGITTSAHHAAARPDLLQRTADRAAPEAERGFGLALMASLSRPAATAESPGAAAQTLASSLIHRFSADSGDTEGRADSPASASALELLRPAGLEPEQPGGSASGARNAAPAAQTPTLDLLQPMREAGPPTLQRALEDAGSGAQGGGAAAAEGGAPAADIEALARQVYARLRRRLKIDAERLGN